jgi:uncharacterized membrane protein
MASDPARGGEPATATMASRSGYGAAMGVAGGLYRFVLLAHITAVVVGFGPTFLNGVYGKMAQRRGGVAGVAISEANEEATSRWAERYIYAVPVLGILLVVLSDGAWGFEQPWIGISMLLYIVVIAVYHAVVRPAHRRLNQVSAELVAMGPPPSGSERQGRPPQVAELEALGKKLAVFGGGLNLLVVVIIALMIWKPGS